MNLLLVMADQLVPFLTGAYGHPVVQTPALDRLAAEGIRFDAAYTPYPLCSPARAALLTGRHAPSLGCYDNASLLPADEPTVAHVRNAGYECVLSGYVPPRVGVAAWTTFLSFDEETHFRALEFIRERGRTGADEPFFLVASYHHTYDPF